MNSKSTVPLYRKEGFFSAVSAGFFFIFLGIIFIISPNLFNSIIEFIQDFDFIKVPNTGFIIWPAPISPGAHTTIYNAVEHFSLYWGIYQIFVLLLRFILGSKLNKKLDTASNIIFWLGTNYIISIFLTESTTVSLWFGFWAVLIMLCGVSLIARGILSALIRML